MKPEQEQYILENISRKSVETIAKTLGIKERKIKRFLERQKSGKGRPSRRRAWREQKHPSPVEKHLSRRP